MTEKKLTEKRNGRNVIVLRQDGNTKWSLVGAGMIKNSNKYLYGEHADKLAEYEAIGTLDECRAAVDKQKEKKPDFDGNNWFRCINGCEVHKKMFQRYNYCPVCGQKLDWSDEG